MKKITVNYKKIDLTEYIKKYYNWDKFNGFCKQCPKYGRLWSCSPYDFDTLDYLKGCKYIYIIGTKVILDKQLIEDVKGKAEIERVTYEIIKSVRQSQEAKLLKLEETYRGSKALYAGSCILCEECKRPSGEACIHKESMRYSLESLGFDVGGTLSDLLGIQLKWAKDSLPEYFTLASAFLTNEANIDFSNF